MRIEFLLAEKHLLLDFDEYIDISCNHFGIYPNLLTKRMVPGLLKILVSKKKMKF